MLRRNCKINESTLRRAGSPGHGLCARTEADTIKPMHERGDTMDQKKTGSFIAGLRKEKGLTQQELADRLRISNKTVSKWECGEGMPDITLLPTLAAELGVTADDLLRGEKAASAPLESGEEARRTEGLRCLWEETCLRYRTNFLACLLAPTLSLFSVICADRIFSLTALLVLTSLLFTLSLFGSILVFFYSTKHTERAARQFEMRCRDARQATAAFHEKKRLRLAAEIVALAACCLLFLVVIGLGIF